jgi:tetratricopeptide (TPR) repeat protein/DNA-binding MarR family transcriptional regulator
MTLRALLGQIREGNGKTVIISGPGGIGKTTLLRWIEEDARGFKLRVRWGQCLPGVNHPFFPIDQLFRSFQGGRRLQQEDSDTWDDGSAPKEKLHPLAELAAKNETAQDLPLAMISVAGKRLEPTPVARAPATVLLEYLSVLEREALTDPLVLLLDDFHWADPDSVQALKFLSRNIRNLPVLLAVALREDEVDDPPFIEVLRDMRREKLVSDIRLKGLNESAARQLLESVAQANIDPAVVRTALRSLMERTGGNPYFLVETAHQLQEGGRIRTVDGKAMLDLPSAEGADNKGLPVPSSVSDLLSKRLQSLSWDERRLLEVASLVGQEFKVAPIQDLIRSPDEGIAKILQKLSAERGLLLEKLGEEPRYSFAHTLLWETVRNSIPSAKKREWSEKLASWWEDHEPADVEKITALYHEGGVGGKGLNWTDKAISISLQAHAHQRVARHFAIGLALLDMDGATADRKVEWGLAVIEKLRRDGADSQALEPLCRDLIELKPSEPLLCNALLELVTASRSRVRESRQLLTKVQRTVGLKPGIATPALLGRIAVIDTTILFREGKIDAARDTAHTALSMLPEGDSYFRGLAHHYLGWIDMMMARWEDANNNLEQGLKYAKSGNTGGLIPRILNLEGAIPFVKGDLVKAEEILTEFLEVARDLGRFHLFVTALGNLSIVMAYRGNLEGAEKTAREALHVAETFAIPTGTGEALQQLGYVRLQRGSPVEAMRYFRMAEKAFTEQGFMSHMLGLHLDMAEAKGAAGDPAGALKDLADAEGDGNLEVDEMVQLHVRKARFSMATGEKDEARRSVESALSQSRERKQRYWEGRALLALADWEGRFGSPGEAAKALDEARNVLRECGVADTTFLIPETTGPTEAPEPKKTGEKRLQNLSLSILKHLADHGGTESSVKPDDVAPLSLTQKGISDGLCLPRDRFSPILKRLSDKGLVTVRTQYVRGQTRQMKVYLLTRAGSEVVSR